MDNVKELRPGEARMNPTSCNCGWLMPVNLVVNMPVLVGGQIVSIVYTCPKCGAAIRAKSLKET